MRAARRCFLAIGAAVALIAGCAQEEQSAEETEQEQQERIAAREEIMEQIDEIAAQVEAGELDYDPSADEDEAVLALREAIPAPEDYPSRSLEIIIGFGEGGGSDNYTRQVGFDASRILGESIVYNNMPGAGGELALGQMLTQIRDGHVLASAITNQVINNALDTQPYSFAEDVEFIIRQQGPTEVYWVRADSEFETFEELMDHVAANPGTIRVAGAGIGSDDEFRLLALGRDIDSEFNYLPLEGAGDRISGVLSGDIDVLHETAGAVSDLYESGEIRPLAYGGDIVFERIDPDIPSVADLGYTVPTGRWRGMVAPVGVDRDIIDYLHNVFYASSQLPNYLEFEHEFHQDVVGGYLGPEDFAEAVLRERDEIVQIAESFGFETISSEEES